MRLSCWRRGQVVGVQVSHDLFSSCFDQRPEWLRPGINNDVLTMTVFLFLPPPPPSLSLFPIYTITLSISGGTLLQVGKPWLNQCRFFFPLSVNSYSVVPPSTPQPLCPSYSQPVGVIDFSNSARSFAFFSSLSLSFQVVNLVSDMSCCAASGAVD